MNNEHYHAFELWLVDAVQQHGARGIAALFADLLNKSVDNFALRTGDYESADEIKLFVYYLDRYVTFAENYDPTSE